MQNGGTAELQGHLLYDLSAGPRSYLQIGATRAEDRWLGRLLLRWPGAVAADGSVALRLVRARLGRVDLRLQARLHLGGVGADKQRPDAAPGGPNDLG